VGDLGRGGRGELSLDGRRDHSQTRAPPKRKKREVKRGGAAREKEEIIGEREQNLARYNSGRGPGCKVKS